MSKTDLTAAVALREFVIRMPLVPWEPPAGPVLELRSIARRIAALVVERTRERNRLHALQATAAASRIVGNDIEVNLRHLERRSELLAAQARALIGHQAELQPAGFRPLGLGARHRGAQRDPAPARAPRPVRDDDGAGLVRARIDPLTDDRLTPERLFVNRATGKASVIPRHPEINDFLARKICRDLEVSDP